jgi:hypothetical protein
MARLKRSEAGSQIFHVQISSLEAKCGDLQDIVSALKTAGGNLQMDVKGLSSEVGGLRDEVKELRDVMSRKRTDAADDVQEVGEEAPSVTMCPCKNISSLSMFPETYLRSHNPDAPNRNRCLETYGSVGQDPN